MLVALPLAQVIHSKLIYNFLEGGGGEGGACAPKGTPYNGLYGESLPERGTFVRSQTYEREGKSVISFRLYYDLKGLQKDCTDVKKSTKFSGFVIFSYLKCSTFIAVKRDTKL